MILNLIVSATLAVNAAALFRISEAPKKLLILIDTDLYDFRFSSRPSEKLAIVARQIQKFAPLIGLWNIFIICMVLFFY